MTADPQTRFDLDAAPLSVSGVTLKVRNLDLMSEYYAGVLGLRIHESDPHTTVLGAARPFLTLRSVPDAGLARTDAPGLFHTAFLLPDRADLGNWLGHATSRGVTLQGASDHKVSEALYLADPEGNGIEIYADRPTHLWTLAGGHMDMPSLRLDFATLPAPTEWRGAPLDTRIGHVHLQTPDIPRAEAFWTGLGLQVTARYPGGSFFGAGGYHHQIAANVWRSAGRSPDPGPTTGLEQIALNARGETPTRSYVAPSGVTVIIDRKD